MAPPSSSARPWTPAYTAFASRKKSEQVTARHIVRRVRDLAKPATTCKQDELFPLWCYHPFFTDNPAETLQAEREHRHHAVVEQVIADSEAGAFPHLPSGHFNTNAVWLILWAMAYNLPRATGALASAFHARPPPPLSAPTWSTSPPGSRASRCTCPGDGPGSTPGHTRSSAPA